MWNVVPGETGEAWTCWRGCSAGEIHPFGGRESRAAAHGALVMGLEGAGGQQPGLELLQKAAGAG